MYVMYGVRPLHTHNIESLCCRNVIHLSSIGNPTRHKDVQNSRLVKSSYHKKTKRMNITQLETPFNYDIFSDIQLTFKEVQNEDHIFIFHELL